MQELETIAVSRFIIVLIAVVAMVYVGWASSHRELSRQFSDWLSRTKH